MFDLKNPATAGFLSGIFALIVSYINNKITKNKQENIVYFKLFVLVFFIVYTVIYINQNNVLNKQTGGSIHTGNPHF